MDKKTLVANELEEGRKFLQLLQDRGFPLDAAFWEEDQFSGGWDLVLVTPLVERLGVRGAYGKLDDILERPRIGLVHVVLLTPRAAFAKSLRKALRNVRNRPVSRRPIGDHFIHGGFVYFVK